MPFRTFRRFHRSLHLRQSPHLFNLPHPLHLPLRLHQLHPYLPSPRIWIGVEPAGIRASG